MKEKSSKKGNKCEVGTAAAMRNDVSRIAGAIESYSESSSVITTRRVDLPRCSIGECRNLMSTIPDVKIRSELYMLGLVYL